MADNTNLEKDNKAVKEEELLLKKEARRKRRKRAQVAAYATLVFFVLLIVSAVVAGVLYAGKLKKDKEVNNNTDVFESIDNLIESEETIVKPDPTPTEEPPAELTQEEKLNAIIDAAIEVMPLEDKVAGLFLVTPESITGVDKAVKAGDGTKDALNNWAVGGIIYDKKNIKSADQFSEMLTNTSLYSRYPLFLGVEEEGGKNSTVAKAGLADGVDSAKVIGETSDPANAYQAGGAVAGYLTTYGINLNLAPVADLNSEGGNVGERAFGSDCNMTASMVTSMSQGLEDNGVSACLKHFPGIGSCKGDVDAAPTAIDRTAEELRAEEFAVFKAGIDAGVDFVMVSNAAAPALTGDNTPCMMAEAVVTDILRNELGFNGVIVTDAMNRKAITEYYEASEAAILALKAGCDMILMPENFEVAYEGVLAAVKDGTISEERINDSLRRIYKIKYADKLAE